MGNEEKRGGGHMADATGAKREKQRMSAPYVKTAAAACLIMSAMIAGTVSFGFFMDPVTRDLGFDRSTFSLYFSLITIVGTITLPVYGKLVARFGTRRFVICGGIWTGLTMAALSLCATLPMFYVVGCLIGLGFFGCSYAVVPVIVNTWFVEKSGFVMGAAAACGGIVAMVLSLVFPAVIESLGWQAGYVLLGCVVFALTTPVGLLLLRSDPSELGLAPFGAQAGAQAGSGSAGELPGVPYATALKMPQLWVILLAFLLLAVTVTVTQHLAAYFVSVGFDAITAGVFMSVISAGIIFTSSGAGIVADKLGLVKTLFLCSALYLVSFILLPATPVVAVICVALILMSIGNANTSVFAPMVTSVAFGPRDYAAIWGLVSMANVLGQAIGAPLWGLAYDLTGSYVPGMYVSAAVIAVAFLMLAWASKPKAAGGATEGAAAAAACPVAASGSATASTGETSAAAPGK
ncbi:MULTISPECIES: MFS transporter [unclassified Adlercreutzia]|uniref:MFS transporter n=1 Tax=unclassified Adlercreutzia TaxID=2636013 RepID=UPI0013ECF4F8|nr:MULTISPECIES: MFS transporter [unclassified Adlercreutzia]